jgi:hypothetical protein
MKELWIEAYDEAADECEGEPTDAAVDIKYQERIDALCDHADMLRKRAREEG